MSDEIKNVNDNEVVVEQSEDNSNEKNNQTDKNKRSSSHNGGAQRPRRKPNNNRPTDEFEEKVIQIKRVIKVTKGGRKFKFSALVVVGDKKGRVGFASAKSIEVPEAIKKAARLARKNLYQVKIVGEQKTISHDYIGHNGSARVLLKPASEGKGIVASDVVRSVVELAGIENIYSKNLGTNNPQSVVLATIDALTSIKTKEQYEKLRDKKIN